MPGCSWSFTTVVFSEAVSWENAIATLLNLNILVKSSWGFLANVYLFKVNNRNSRKKVWIMLEAINKNTRTMSITSFWCFYCKLWTYFVPFSNVSIVDFEEVNVSWVSSVLVSQWIFNPSRPNPGRREKSKLDFYFHTSLWCLKRFYECLKGQFLFQYKFQKRTGQEGWPAILLRTEVFSQFLLVPPFWQQLNFVFCI